jgi:thiol:disulfide interchange protein DsbD
MPHARPRVAARLLGAVAIALLLAAAPAGAEPSENPGRIPDLTARLEPATIEAGGEGTLVVTARWDPKIHIYAAGEDGMRVRPLAPAGVEMGVAGKTWGEKGATADSGVFQITKPHPYLDKNFDEWHQVWEGEFELRVPVRVLRAAPPDATVGVSLHYNGCTSSQCYMPERDHRASAPLGAPVSDAGTSSTPADGEETSPEAATNGAAPAPAGGAPAAKPLLGVRKELPAGAGEVRLEIREKDETSGTAVVTFTPAEGFHFYLPGNATGNAPIDVRPRGKGVVWGEFVIPEGEEFYEPVAVEIPYSKRTADRLSVLVAWQACNESNCLLAENAVLEVVWSATLPPLPTPDAGEPPDGGDDTAAPSAGATNGGGAPGEASSSDADLDDATDDASEGILFPVVTGDKDRLGATASTASGDEDVGADLERRGLLLSLGLAFLIGMGLTLTPCVLPILPITVSIVLGGRSDLTRRRRSFLLSLFVLGLALAFATLGTVASLTGSSISVAFQMPGVIAGIAILFVLLGFGMLGVYEARPPEFLLKMQGGAQRRAGSAIGAFIMGALMAVIASPCTGPFIAGLLIYIAKQANPLLGFAMFLALGLGMGAVFFLAASSLNALLRPGPWMVWVRYGFGAIMIGMALYYAASAGLIGPIVVFATGFAVALLAWFGVSRHLVKKEGATSGEAQMRGAKVAVMLVVVTGLVAFLTRPVDADLAIRWTKLRDVEHLQAEVADAVAKGQPVVVDVWAKWCEYCKEYEKLIAEDEGLREGFGKVRMLKIDISEVHPAEAALRAAVGIPANVQPALVFFDRHGRIRKDATIKRWLKAESTEALRDRMNLVLTAETASR